jgi:hypothetical protein
MNKGNLETFRHDKERLVIGIILPLCRKRLGTKSLSLDVSIEMVMAKFQLSPLPCPNQTPGRAWINLLSLANA